MNERLYSPKKIKEVINEENFNFSKALGQNFLIDGNFVRKIADLADIGKDDTVIEIGLGIGTLTEELLLRAKKVIGIELDKRLIPILEKTLEGFDNFELISGDALKIDFSEFFKSGENIKLVSNLPYNVGTPILTRILGNRYPFESLTIMLQKEVVDRITAKFSDKNYSSLTILCNYFARVQDGFIIPKTVFMPMPKIDSKVIRLDLKNEEKKPYEDILFELVRAGFNKRRKTILNSLQTKSYNKEIIEKALDNLDIPKNLRAENLSLQQYESISKFIYENI
ncbi:16S rRNA (adenine(1518)-N(6)/adenine(1519)-N(6))-dimethyltransferase RsmA [Citroniella saccharovorans]|uniref:Ribosomal RNA small subunit methyltransferase A n=1 Tax=Citroniella saccharovorans TaxID=2053367 RepID=A0AAW9MT05_9FIRM|nr:16S rRNA (adenine(1518)-N(6)/adenine(1519)-N(6))-dimethyltransferase RsmA [Citroniella saccharovorans]MEB3429151.1 16S rRNA (adenine(1518)-N(6)/adenine(1519)-N(6))-dimethyltransferase RsmA [Citroniella saccharovorans]